MEPMPQVTVAVINFNYGRFLSECLKSIERQNNVQPHVLFVDDASTDESHQIFWHWAQSSHLECRAVIKPRNVGVADSYNRVIDETSTEYVKFLDADDCLAPGSLADQLMVHRNEPESVVALYADSIRFSPEGAIAVASPTLPPGDPALKAVLERGVFFALGSATIRTSALKRVPAFDTDLRLCDLRLWLELAKRGEFKRYEKVTTLCRVHTASFSHTLFLEPDCLRILASIPGNPIERKWSRVRGRSALKSALIASNRLPLTVLWRYGLVCRDWQAILFGLAAQLAPLRRLIKRFVGLRSGRCMARRS